MIEVHQLEKRAKYNYSGSETSLGVFSATALILLLWGYCWWKSNFPMTFGQRINVVFREIAGLNDNASVFVNGVRIGAVEKLEWQKAQQVLVRLRIHDAHLVVPQGAHFQILTNGIIGAKYVEIVLPRQNAGMPAPSPLDDTATVMGDDPVRPELAINNLAIGLSKVDTERFQTNLEEVRVKMLRAADKLSVLADAFTPLVQRAKRILSDPNFSEDLKETVQKAKDTAISIQAAIRDMNVTLSDQPLRKDLLRTLTELNNSTQSIERSVGVVQSISSDKSLRSDMKQILIDARHDLDQVNRIIDDPTYGTNIKTTLAKTQMAIEHVDLAARQINQILEKRHPLLHMITGRPGYIKLKDDERDITLPVDNIDLPRGNQ